MFWNVIRWGGTALVVVLLVALFASNSDSEPTDGVVQTEESGVEAVPVQPSENKNFNL